MGGGHDAAEGEQDQGAAGTVSAARGSAAPSAPECGVGGGDPVHSRHCDALEMGTQEEEEEGAR